MNKNSDFKGDDTAMDDEKNSIESRKRSASEIDDSSIFLDAQPHYLPSGTLISKAMIEIS